MEWAFPKEPYGIKKGGCFHNPGRIPSAMPVIATIIGQVLDLWPQALLKRGS